MRVHKNGQVSYLNTQIRGFACDPPSNVKTSEDTVPFGTLPRGVDFKRLTKIELHHEVLEDQSSLELAIEAANNRNGRVSDLRWRVNDE